MLDISNIPLFKVWYLSMNNTIIQKPYWIYVCMYVYTTCEQLITIKIK